MKFLYLLNMGLCLAFFTSCEVRQASAPAGPSEQTEKNDIEDAKEIVAPSPVHSMVMLHVVNQGYDYKQPWNKLTPNYSSGFAVYLGDGRFLTNAGIAVSSTFLEMLSPDGSKTIMGKVEAMDCEANLAIVKVEGDAAQGFLEGLVPVELAEPPSLGAEVQIWQFNDEGLPIITNGVIESTQLNVPMASNIPFVLYQIRSAVNVVTGGSTMPVMIGDKLASISLSSETSEQTVLALPAPVIKSFLERALGPEKYEGIPVFGLQPFDLMDPVFRKYLKLPETGGGVYALRISPSSSAYQAGIRQGDVIETINGMPVNGRGIVQDEKLGPVSCGMYLHDLTRIGDEIQVGIRRNGESQTITVTMNRDSLTKAIVNGEYSTEQPRYMVYGGLVFQPLTQMYISEVFEGNPNKMPLEYLEAFEKREVYEKEDRNEILLLSGVLPTSATHGYGSYGQAVVKTVDGEIPKDMKHLARLLDEKSGQDVIKIETNKAPYTIYFSPKEAKAADDYIKRVAFEQLRNL